MEVAIPSTVAAEAQAGQVLALWRVGKGYQAGLKEFVVLKSQSLKDFNLFLILKGFNT